MHQPLSSLNLTKQALQQMKKVGFNYCQDEKVDEKFPLIKPLTEVPPTRSAWDLYQEECLRAYIPSLIGPLDEVLGGGFPVGLISEVVGDADVNKTELCYRICVNAQLPSWCGGTDGGAVFVGTNKKFGVHRLRGLYFHCEKSSFMRLFLEICKNCVERYNALKISTNPAANPEFNVEKLLENIEYVNTCDVVELIATVKYLQKWLENHRNTKVIVIDSISAPFKQSPLENRKFLFQILSDLQSLSLKYGFAVSFLVTQNKRNLNFSFRWF